MAIKTYRVGSGADGNFAALFEADQTAASRADGWTLGKIAANFSSEFDVGVKQATTAFTANSTTPKPASFLTGATANAFKTPAALTGTYANTAWTFTFALRATIVSAQTGRIRMRVFKSVNADGSGATEITGATQVGTTSAVLSTTADVTTVVTWSPGAITLNNEFLFFVIAWEIIVASGSNTSDAVIRTGQVAAGSRLVTPDFAVPVSVNSSDTGTATEGASVVITADSKSDSDSGSIAEGTLVDAPIPKSSSDSGIISESALTQLPTVSIDDFNRADNPVYSGAGASVWTNHRLGVATLTPMVVRSNQLATTTTNGDISSGDSVSTVILESDFDFLIDATVTGSLPERGLTFTFCLSNVDSLTFKAMAIGYAIGGGIWSCAQYPSGQSGQSLGTFPGTQPQAGETYWIAKRGLKIFLYKTPVGGGAFSLIGSWTCGAGQSQAGAFGIGMRDTTQRWDNLRAGPVFVPVTPISDSDATGTASESASALSQVPTSDLNGPEVESASLTVAASVSETGGESEIATATAAVSSSDTGAVAENISLVRTQVSASDSGGISEAISLVLTSVLTSDVGTVSETISLSRTPVLVSDTGTAAETTTFSLAPIVVSDAGAISDNALLVRATKSDSDIATSLEVVNVDTGAPPGSASVFTVRVSALRSNDALRGISVLQVTGAFDIGVVSESAALVVKQASSDANFATVENFTLVAKSLTADQNGVFAEVASFAYAPASSDANSVTTENVSLVARPITADTNSVTTETGVSTIAVAHADSGTIVETITLLARPIGADSGVATENSVSTVILGSSDTGTASTETASTVVSALGVSDTGLGSDQGVVRAYTASGDVSVSTENASLAARPVTGDSGSVTEGAILGSRLSTADVNGITVEFTVIGLATADQGYGIDNVIIFAGYTDSDTGTATEDILLTLKGGKPKPYAPHQIQAAEVREAVLVAAGIESGELEISEHEIPRLVSAGTAKVAIESARHDIPTITSSLR